MQARCDQDSDSGGCPLCLALCHLGGCSRVCLAFLDVKVRATIPSRIGGGKVTRGSTKSKKKSFKKTKKSKRSSKKRVEE